MTIRHRSSTTIPQPARRDVGSRVGGIAGHVVAGTYVFGFLLMLAYLAPRGYTDATASPAASLDFLADHAAAMYGWYLILYMIGGAALTVLVLALHRRLQPAEPGLANTATAFGLIWSGLLLASGMIALVGQRAVLDFHEIDHASAITSWHSVSIIQDGLGGGLEIVGALWVLLVSIAAYRRRVLPRPLALLGAALALIGLCTLAPTLTDGAASVFGLGMIIWFTWTATLLVRADTSKPRIV